MFHYTNLGSFGEALKKYADLDGFVPEAGDSPEDFNWSHDHFQADFDDQGDGYEGYAASKWQGHLEEAVEATKEAEEALEEWRNS